MAEEDELEAVGWDDITAAFEALYGPGEPAGHWGAIIPWSLGGPDPLQGVSVYASSVERPHWHYVTLGLTELFQKESEDAEVSGWGFELCLRLARKPGDEQPPIWPINLLQNLARYVFKSGNVFAPGHHMNANGPICLDAQTQLRALAFTRDPALPPRKSPNGHYELLHVVGVTLDELDAIQLWNAEAFLELVSQRGALVTDLERDSYLADTSFAAQVQQARQREGSSCGSLYNPRFGFTTGEGSKPSLALGAKEVALFAQLLPARLLHERALELVGSEHVVRFEPAAERHLELQHDRLLVQLTPADIEDIAATLKPRAGVYEAAGIHWAVEKSIVQDEDGNVVEELG